MSEELTIKQRRAIKALMVSSSLSEAARAAGVSPRSLTRWLDDPTFRAELTRQEQAAIDAASRRLAGLAAEAVREVEAILKSEAAPSIKLRTAEMILSHLLRLRELVNLEARVSALEEKQNGLRKTS